MCIHSKYWYLLPDLLNIALRVTFILVTYQITTSMIDMTYVLVCFGKSIEYVQYRRKYNKVLWSNICVILVNLKELYLLKFCVSIRFVFQKINPFLWTFMSCTNMTLKTQVWVIMSKIWQGIKFHTY